MASGYYGTVDPAPADTRRRALQALAEGDHTRRTLQHVLFPGEPADFVRAEWTAQALRWLHDHGHVRKLPGRYWRATPEGVEGLRLASVFCDQVEAGA